MRWHLGLTKTCKKGAKFQLVYSTYVQYSTVRYVPLRIAYSSQPTECPAANQYAVGADCRVM
jgi:hypothetical protein